MPPMQIAFATCAVYPGGRPDDAQVAALVGAQFRVWDDPAVAWSLYDLVVIRSVWDYSHRVNEFLDWCRSLGGQRLRNRPELVAFNADKRYLTALGVPIAPTSFLQPGDHLEAFDGEIVVKPNVSAGARNTGRFQPEAADEAADLVRRIHASGRVALVQPYLPAVDAEGETAVIFFGGSVSHVLTKRPVLRTAGVAPLAEGAHGPAAVMLEHDLVSPSTASDAQLHLANSAHGALTDRFGTPLYLRVDVATGLDGEPVLMELEAIEPRLYLELAPGSVERFAAAIGRSTG
jgi:hypothetical protein